MRCRTLLVGGSFSLLLTSFAFADELTPGKYSESYNPPQFANALITFTLDITSVENGVIAGQGQRSVTSQTGTRMQQGCIGGFPIKGTVKGDVVDIMAAEKWGPNGECQFRVRGTVSGGKISGKIGQSDIVLSK
jgi:hypothetical protein